MQAPQPTVRALTGTEAGLNQPVSPLRRRRRRAGSRASVQQDAARLEQRIALIVGRVRAIPAGFVRTYGDIDPSAPRLVGHVLATTHNDLPWHRVVRADGSLAMGAQQRALLLEEGVPMRGDHVDLRQARMVATLAKQK
jgi:methylated-DNA-protein-cysteine methyltransferase-like protein